MNRRDFIRVVGAGSSVVLVPSVLNGCSHASQLSPWLGNEASSDDIRLVAISYGLLAPNPHNIQPWLVDLREPGEFDLYVDPERLLPHTDPYFRQIHIGQGAFLENVCLTARAHGYQAELKYFPQGEYANTELPWQPVARVRLLANAALESDPLYRQIPARQSNKRAYSGQPVRPERLRALERSHSDTRYSLAVTSEPSKIAELRRILTEAMRIEVADRQRDHETIAMFRFNDQEIDHHRDGFGVPQTGTTGLRKMLIEGLFISRESALAPGSDFGEQSVQMTQKQVDSTASFGWLTSPVNSRRNQLEVGRAYERLNLTATALGITMHPLSQVLQEYADMAPLQRELLGFLEIPSGHSVQMLFRLGQAAPVVHTPRRPVQDLLL